MESVNLIPSEERDEQTKTKVVKFSTTLTIILLIIVCGVGGFYFYQNYKIKKEISSLDTNITKLRTEINNLSNIEINARNLYKKSSTLKGIFDNRLLYSKILINLQESTPANVIIESVSFGLEDTINITGNAQTYNLVQDFSNMLLSKDLFTEVSLNTVSLKGNDKGIDFFVVVSFDSKLLHDQ
ncbi:hypothetical protein A2V49_03065 [candidate division WWE3 bacterium RBG_19FT_COMBO_34_6]|uniref:PilN domain-containing protein n=1 Tax=candidate division WWE3 bacterium RBG_19FT_COMBO_34_6 TaxID=1802612 RepID=A0A1F4ULJ3_UNCKA|nr:MAG: hypothetical protein A2V49_03065 [candidate division WWE3 bacterium RBG_19FT_COMBO_34_6]